jgi:predicted MFS family arabinose efflux permease
MISSGASVVYCLGAIVGFFVASRHPRGLVVAAALSASLGAAGMTASLHTGMFATFAILGSAGAGLASPGLVDIVRRNVSGRANDRSQAAVNAGSGPGLVVAGVLALLLLPSWRLAWMCVAAFTLVIAALVLLLDRGPGQDVPIGNDSGVPPAGWFTAHQHIILAVFLMGVGSAAVWNFGRTLLVAAGASEAASVAAWIALGVGGTAVIASAPLFSILSPRSIWTGATLMVAVSTATLGLAPDATGVTLAACAVFGWGYTAGTGALIAWTTEIDPTWAAAGTSLLFVIFVLGQAVGATAIGALVATAGFAPAFFTAAVVVLTSATTPFVRRPTRGVADVGV